MKTLPPAALIALMLALAALLFSGESYAQTADPTHVMAQLMEGFEASRGTWLDEIIDFATWLFWSFALIGIVWQFGMMLFGNVDFGAFIGNLVRVMVLVSVFLWLLSAGSGDDGLMMQFADSIATLGARMAGSAAPPPDNLIMPGLRGLQEVIRISGDLGANHFNLASNLALITVVALTLATVNIVLLTVALWILAYAGIFLLGFGGARWTSDIAVNYFKHVGSVVFSLLVLRLVSAIASVKLEALYAATAGSSFTLMNQALVMVMAVALAVLMTRLPGLLSSILLGARVAQGNSAYFLSGQAAAVAGTAFSAAGQSISTNAQAIYTAYGRNQGWGQEERSMFDTRVAQADAAVAARTPGVADANTGAVQPPNIGGAQSWGGDAQRSYDSGAGRHNGRDPGGSDRPSDPAATPRYHGGAQTAPDRTADERAVTRDGTRADADSKNAPDLDRRAHLADPQAAESRFGTTLEPRQDLPPALDPQHNVGEVETRRQAEQTRMHTPDRPAEGGLANGADQTLQPIDTDSALQQRDRNTTEDAARITPQTSALPSAVHEQAARTAPAEENGRVERGDAQARQAGTLHGTADSAERHALHDAGSAANPRSQPRADAAVQAPAEAELRASSAPATHPPHVEHSVGSAADTGQRQQRDAAVSAAPAPAGAPPLTAAAPAADAAERVTRKVETHEQRGASYQDAVQVTTRMPAPPSTVHEQAARTAPAEETGRIERGDAQARQAGTLHGTADSAERHAVHDAGSAANPRSQPRADAAVQAPAEAEPRVSSAPAPHPPQAAHSVASAADTGQRQQRDAAVSAAPAPAGAPPLTAAAPAADAAERVTRKVETHEQRGASDQRNAPQGGDASTAGSARAAAHNNDPGMAHPQPTPAGRSSPGISSTAAVERAPSAAARTVAPVAPQAAPAAADGTPTAASRAHGCAAGAPGTRLKDDGNGAAAGSTPPAAKHGDSASPHSHASSAPAHQSGASSSAPAHTLAPAGARAGNAVPLAADRKRSKRLMGELLSEEDSARARKRDQRDAAARKAGASAPQPKGKRGPAAADAEDEIARFRDGPDNAGAEHDG